MNSQVKTAHETIIAGNVSTAAWHYLESQGAQVEEKEGLVSIQLPQKAEMHHWRYAENQHVAVWAITFDDEGDPDAKHVIVEVELLPYDSRIYVLSL